ncbi:MAG: hypothetical protein PHE49_06555 [bacterium]|nr:hypothetical protein [bacterium]
MIKRLPTRRDILFLFLLLLNSSYLLYANEFIISNAQNKQSTPDISQGDNNILIVWQDYRNSNADIWAQFVDFSGNLIGSNFSICNKSYDQRLPVVQWGNTSYLVVWEQGIGNGNFHIYGQLIDSNGNLIGAEIPISTVNNKSQQPAISFGNSKWLVVWADSRNNNDLNIYGQMIDLNGVLIDTAIPIATTLKEQLAPALTWAENKKSWLVIWEDKRSDTSDIWGQIIDTLGILVNSNFPICRANNNQLFPDVASNGTEWLTIWSDYRNGSSYNSIYAQFVDTSGFIVGTNFLFAETLDYNLYSPKVVWNGNRWVVIYVENNKIIHDNILISNSPQDAFFPELISIGNNCLSVWQDNRNNTWDDYDIYANLFTPAGIEEKWSEATSCHDRLKLTISPNPFYNKTIIQYSGIVNRKNISDNEYTNQKIAIYNISGKLVKSFPLITFESEFNPIIWDGKDNFGQPVLPGIYFCRFDLFSINNLNITKKIIRLAFDKAHK